MKITRCCCCLWTAENATGIKVLGIVRWHATMNNKYWFVSILNISTFLKFIKNHFSKIETDIHDYLLKKSTFFTFCTLTWHTFRFIRNDKINKNNKIWNRTLDLFLKFSKCDKCDIYEVGHNKKRNSR